MDLNAMINKEDETIAIEVLEGMKKPFLARVNEIPIVHTISNQIQNAYTKTKNTNEILRYSAESLESVVKKGKPVLQILEPLDRFACDQLDRVEYMYRERTLPKMVGNIGASMGVLGDETIKSLRYCLQYLQYALSSMGHQIRLLQHSIENQFHKASGSVQVVRKEVSVDNVSQLIMNVKKEIVETLKRVVDMLGRYSSNYLPVDAKQSVRSFILNLPNRLSSLRPGSDTKEEAQNVLVLATESKNMLESIEQVISDTVVAAEKTLGHSTPLTPTDLYDVNGKIVEDMQMEQVDMEQ